MSGLLNRVLNYLADTDQVIEQGKSGSWYYRKWKSGRRECWGAFGYPNTAMTTQEGSGYYAAQKTINFPSNFFSDRLTAIASAELDGALGGFSVRSADKTSMTGYFWATRSTTKNCWLNIYAIDRSDIT